MENLKLYEKIKFNPLQYIFSVAISFCSLTLLPAQDVLLYSKAIERGNMAKILIFTLILHFILILFTHRNFSSTISKILFIFSIIFTIIYIVILINLRILFNPHLKLFIRTFVSILSLSYFFQGQSIYRRLKNSKIEGSTIEEPFTDYEVESQGTKRKKYKYYTNDFYKWMDEQRKAADLNIIGTIIGMIFVIFASDDYIHIMIYIYFILNGFKRNHLKWRFNREN